MAIINGQLWISALVLVVITMLAIHQQMCPCGKVLGQPSL